MLAIAPLVFAFLAQTAPTPQPTVTAESLIPAHSFAVLRAKSLDRLAEIALPFQRVEDEHAPPLDALALIGGTFGLQVQWDLIDHARPFIFVVSSSQLNQPAAFTLIASSKDAAALSADPSWKDSGWTCTAHDALVVITTEPNDAALPKESPLLVGLDRGDIVVRLDVQEVMAQYGEEFRDKVRSGFENDMSAAGNEDQTAATKNVLDGVLEVVDSIETFGITVLGTGERMRLGFEMSGLPGSALVGVAKVDPKPLEALARCIDPASSIAFISAMDWTGWMKSMKPLMELGASGPGMPEVSAMLKNIDEFYANVGSHCVGGARFGKDGIAVTSALRPTSVPKLIESYVAMLRVPEMPFDVQGPTTETIAGHEVTRYRMKIDLDKVPGAAVDSAGAAGRAAANEMLEKLFGADAIPFAYTVHEGTMIMSMGREAEMAAAIARAAATKPSAVGTEMLSLLGPLNPGMAMRFDTPALVEGFLALGTIIEGKPAPNAEAITAAFKDCAPVTLTVGLDQRTWRLTFEADAVRMMKAFAALPHDEEEEEPADEMDGAEPETK